MDLDEKLFEVFKYNLENEYYIQQEIGFINSPNFLNYVTYIWDRRTNLSRVHLKINYFNVMPYIIYQNNSKEIKGYHGEIFNTLQEKLQFSYDIQEEKIFGGPDNNSIYNGMLGKIQAGYNNWSIADCVQTEERSLTFDFSIQCSYLIGSGSEAVIIMTRKSGSVATRKSLGTVEQLTLLTFD